MRSSQRKLGLPVMFRAKMLANRRRHVLALLDALMQVPARKTNITCIAQVTFKKVN